MNSLISQVDFNEAKVSQLPFVELLINLGYSYLPSAKVNEERGGDVSKFVLKNIALEQLKKINSYEHKGERYQFTDKELLEAIEELENVSYEGLIDTSKKVFNLIMPTTGGKSVQVLVDGKRLSKSVRYIDFEHPENNSFHVAVEFEAIGKSPIRPDIVVFVNGIPLAVIENKRSGEKVAKAIEQHVRNQRPEYCPKLYTFAQLLVASNGDALRYGTTGTPSKFYSEWKEKDRTTEEQDIAAKNLIEQEIYTETYDALCTDLNSAMLSHNQKLNRLPTEQDRAVISLFDKARFLDLCKNYVLFDAGVKKLARYQQYFAVKKIFDRIESGDPSQKREGGLVWHTQGSGKSLTMVMFVKALIDHPHIKNPRVILVTDRRDLDKQLGDTFKNCGLKKKVHRAKSGQDLLNKIKEKDLSVITALVQKFESAAKKRAGFVDEDRDVFVLIDEAHRTQSGIANMEMNRVLPNACYIAFTGTPLMKKEAASYLKFGSYIDKYTIDQAIKDKVVLPLIYEGRYVDLEQNKGQIDRQAEQMIGQHGSKEQRDAQKHITKEAIKNNPGRIREIAYDIQNHYVHTFQGSGLKGQIVAPSKYSAVLFKKYLDESGLISSAVVISDESGIVNEDDDHKKEVVDYLQEVSDKYRSLKSYESEVIESFKHNDEGIEMLIVVDKLLTGFDAPRNTILYLAKDLKDHNLLQAIARVNRLYENESLPKTSGYIVDYSENAKNLDNAMKLFGNFADEDVQGALFDLEAKTGELESAYSELHDIFKGLPADHEAFIQHLEAEPDRRMFYESYNSFVRLFSECFALKDFATEFKHIDTYQKELKKFTELRRDVRMKYADEEQLDAFKRPLIKLLDKYIDAKGVELLTAPVDITDPKRFGQAIEELGSDKSKAEAIAAYMSRTIHEKEQEDPEFYTRFSEKIDKVITSMKEGKMTDAEALGQMKLIKDSVLSKKDEESPRDIQSIPGASVFFRNLKNDFAVHQLDDQALTGIVLGMLEVMKLEAIVDWHKNSEVRRIMASRLDDYLYDVVRVQMSVNLSSEETKNIVDKAIQLAIHNHEDFKL